jgi:hypothetical protein
MNVLVGCEESQAVCNEFRKLGHNAYSCDLQKCSGGHPEWHFNCDVFSVIDNHGGITQNGDFVEVDNWNLFIVHPPCTYLAVSGARWLYNKDGSRNEKRWKQMEEALEFVIKLANVNIEMIAIENPIGMISTNWKKPTQIINPWQFGDEAKKATCLWLKNLKPLIPLIDKEPSGLEYTYSSGKKLPKWFSDAVTESKKETQEWVKKNGIDTSTTEGKKLRKEYCDNARRRLRSKTFIGIAKAMAETWG